MPKPVIPGTAALWDRLEHLYDTKQVSMIPAYIQPELFHYTTVEGLKGIIESNSLWATSAYHLNDSSEIEYGCHLVTDILDEWVKANQQPGTAPTIPLLALDLVKDSFGQPFSRVGRHVGIYVSCFCDNGNLLSQWRAYGQSGGYSIGMLASGLEITMSAPGLFATRLVMVNYSPHTAALPNSFTCSGFCRGRRRSGSIHSSHRTHRNSKPFDEPSNLPSGIADG
jgi:hypothetical protein